MERSELLEVLQSHIVRMRAARAAFLKASRDPRAARVDSRAADDADYAICSFIDRHGDALLSALSETTKPAEEREGL